MNKIIALLVAAALIAFGIHYFRRHAQKPVAVIETQVDIPQDAAPEVAVEQEAAQ